MIAPLLNPEVQNFIAIHEHDDERLLVLSHKEIFGLPSSVIADQITGRRKAKTKLQTFYKKPGIVYPPRINIEQCSSEQTALFKASIILNTDKVKPGRALDLTGGFGIDTFFFSKVFNTIDYIEPDVALSKIVAHNLHLLGAGNVQYNLSTAEEFLATCSQKYDLIYIDPSRRPQQSKKVFKLSECAPDITQLAGSLFEKTNSLLIKTSPLLDLKQGLRELAFVNKVFVVSVDNECKEVLFYCQKGSDTEPEVIAVNLLSPNVSENFSFLFSDEESSVARYSEPLSFFYEPNASILKAGAFKILAQRYNLKKLHPSTHLYTADFLLPDFPGRIFKSIQTITGKEKNLHEIFPEGKANIITRNYPLRPEELAKKTKLKDGGEKYLLAFSGQNKKHLIAATRIK